MALSRTLSGSSIGSYTLEEARDLSAKNVIKAKLIAAIKDMQVDQSINDGEEVTSSNCNALCTALEAMFVHGTKQSSGLLGKLNSSLLAGVTSGETAIAKNKKTRPKKLPHNNFWYFLMVFSHKETLRQIESLSQINTDVGRSRAWIRLALNDGLLRSYLTQMAKDRETVKQHYEKTAFMRDSETVEIIARYIIGIELFNFKLVLNASILNKWQTPPLIMAGLWVPDSGPSYSSSLIETAEAIDIASELDVAEEAISSPSLSASSSITNLSSIRPLVGHQDSTFFSRGLMNEDDALKLILKSSTPTASESRNNKSTNNNSSDANSVAGSPSPSHLADKSKRKHRRKDKGIGKRTKEIQTREKVNSDLELDDCKRKGLSNIEEGPDSKENPSESNDKKQKTSSSTSCEPVSNLNESSLHEESSSFNTDEDSIYIRQTSSTSSNYRDDSGTGGARIEINYVERIIEDMEAEDRKARAVQKKTKVNKGSTVSSSPETQSSTPQDKSLKGGKKTPTLLEKAAQIVAEDNTLPNLPCLSGFIYSWNPFGSDRYFDTPPRRENADSIYNRTNSFDLSMQPDMSISSLNVVDSQKMMSLFDKIVTEAGLDEQNYQCVDCGKAIGTIFGPAKVCGYTKYYYCDECHFDETSIIPSKIVYNWDFRRFRVCHKAKLFLSAMNNEPVIDAMNFTQELFEFAPELDDVVTLRKQLRYISAYLTTCQKSNAMDEFVKILQPRRYLYMDENKYSITDFEDIKNGDLKNILYKAFHFGETHIMACVLCSGKGFICELCGDNKPLYPFHLEEISQCQKCFTVFHLECSLSLKVCPKCERREARNLNYLVNQRRIDRDFPLTT